MILIPLFATIVLSGFVFWFVETFTGSPWLAYVLSSITGGICGVLYARSSHDSE